MKNFIFGLTVLMTALALRAEPLTPVLPFRCIDMNHENPDRVPVFRAMRQMSHPFMEGHPEIFKGAEPVGLGIGNCLDLPHTSILAVADGEERKNFPKECMGISFSVTTPEAARELTQKIIGMQDAEVDGANGAIILKVEEKEVRVPICLDVFSGGGPQ